MKNLSIDKVLRSKLALQAVRTWWSVQPKQIMPHSEDPILNTPAVVLSRMIREGKLTSTQVTQTMINRCKETQPLINAVTELFEGDALMSAKEVDDYLAKLDKQSAEFAELAVKKPFLGVPFTLKDSLMIKGKRLYCGLWHRAHEPPSTEDALVAQRMMKAGSFPLAHTNVPPSVIAWESDNALFGRTSTPYDLRCTCGGSSGGEGAIIAAQGSVMGIGSDIAGSIRMPALLNGLYGIRPWAHSTPSDGHFPFPPEGEIFELTGIGPITRYVEDIAPMFEALADKPGPSGWQDRAPTKLVVCSGLDEDYCTRLSAPQLDAFNESTKFLKNKYNLKPEMYTMPPSDHLIKMYQNTLYSPLGPQGFDHYLGGGKPFNTETEMMKTMAGLTKTRMCSLMLSHQMCQPIPDDQRQKLSDDKARFTDEFFKMVDDNTVFVFPAFPQTHYFHTETVPAVWDTFYTAVFNLLGAPAMIVPIGLDQDGYPKCVQLVTRRDNDWLLFKVAKDLTEKFGGWKPPRA